MQNPREAYEQRKREEAEERRDRLRFLFGMANFGSVVLGAAVFLVALMLTISIISWLQQDVLSTFAILRANFIR